MFKIGDRIIIVKELELERNGTRNLGLIGIITSDIKKQIIRGHNYRYYISFDAGGNTWCTSSEIKLYYDIDERE
jgi:hypothetical protein